MRYYTCGAGGNFSHHVLLSDETILDISNTITAPDIYCSVQEYDSNGKEIASQLVFDIDSSDMLEAYETAIEIQDDIQHRYDTDVAIWFSGSKGFHVITGLVATHSKANLAMKRVAHRISDNIDDSMYKSRSMFRLPNTLNSKSGLYKIQVRYGESLPSIMERAKTKQPYDKIELVRDNAYFNNDHAMAVVKLSEVKTHDVTVRHMSWEKSLPPCIKTLLETTVPSGYRWDMCFWLVRHWRLCGVSVDEAIRLSHMFGIFRDACYTSGMIHHYYNGIIRSVGCLTGPLSKVMRDNCSRTCQHSEEWADHVTSGFLGGMQWTCKKN